MSQQIVGKRVLLKSVSGEYLLPYVDSSGTGNPDNKTIMINDQVQLVAFGNTTRDGSYNYDWFGTVEEYNAATEAGTIQPDWTCFITDFDTAQLQGVERKHVLNIPFTLLQSWVSDQPIKNASWLESLGQWNDGTLYSDVYDAIATEIDTSVAVGTANEKGYIKRGLTNVKLSTDAYDDLDFVINQTDHTFRLPLKLTHYPMINNAPVAGNGKTLGLTNGVINVGLSVSDGGVYLGYESDYDENIGVGTSTRTGVFATPRDMLGITTDPTKSGIEVRNDVSTLHLYFYVGEVIQDVQTIAANNVLSALPRKLDIDLANLPDDTRSMMAGFGMPSDRYIDLTLGASGTTYTAPANGWITLWKEPTTDGQSLEAEVIGGRLGAASISNGSWWLRISFPVRKGDNYIIAYTAGGLTRVFRFIYAEGSEND